MNKQVIYKALFVISLFFTLTAKGQSNFDKTFLWLFQNVSSFHGNVFLDTTYKKLDTTQLRATYGDKLSEELEVAKIYKLKLKDFSFKNISPVLNRVMSIEKFYKERYRPINYSSTADSIAIVKFEQLANSSQKFISNEKALDSLRKAEALLSKSAFHEKIYADEAKGKPKRMTIISVLENERVYLVIYEFMILFGYPHYYVKSELILK